MKIDRVINLICNAGMKDIDEIRRENLRLIQEELGGPSKAAKRLDMPLAQFISLRDGAVVKKTGKRRGMRTETARRIELLAGKPPGWLDTDHAQSDTSVHPVMEPSAAYLQHADKDAIRSVRLTHSCLNRNKADFLLHRGRFRLGVTAKASAFPSTGRHRGTRGVILQVDRGI